MHDSSVHSVQLPGFRQRNSQRTYFLHRLGTALCLVPSSEPHLRKPRNLSQWRRWRTTEYSVRDRMRVRVSGLRTVTSTESLLSSPVAAVTIANEQPNLYRHGRWSAKPFDFRQPRIPSTPSPTNTTRGTAASCAAWVHFPSPTRTNGAQK